MNPNNIRNPQDRRKVYDEYIANLDAQIENLSKTENAVKTLATTGQAPVQPTDTRTLNEKLLDIEGQKRVLRQALRDVTDGENANIIMNTISDEDVVFLAMAFPEFSKLLKSKFASGVPAAIFNDYLQRYKADYISTVRSQKGESQGKDTTDLLLSIRELARLAPTSSQLNDLQYAVDGASRNGSISSIASQEISDILSSISELDILIPTEDQILTLDGLDVESQQDAQRAFNDGLSSITTGAIIQSLTQQLQQASSPQQAKSVLEQILTNIVLTSHDRDALAVAQGIAQQTSANEIQSRLEKVTKYKSVQIPKHSAQMPSEQAMLKAIVIDEIDADDFNAIEKIQTSVLRDWLRMKGVEAGEPIPSAVLRKLDRIELEIIIQKVKTEGWLDGVNLVEGILPPTLEAYKVMKGKERTRQEQLASIVQPAVYDMNDFLTLDEFRDNLTFDQKTDYFKKLRDDGEVDLLGKFSISQLQKAFNEGPQAESILDMLYGDLITTMDNANDVVNETAGIKAQKKLQKSQKKTAPKGEEVFVFSEEEIPARPTPAEPKRAPPVRPTSYFKKGFEDPETRTPTALLERATSSETRLGVPSEVRDPFELRQNIASMATISKLGSREALKEYMMKLMDTLGADSKLAKGDTARLTTIFESSKPVSDAMYRDMVKINEKMLQKHGTKGYGLAIVAPMAPKSSMKMKISEKKAEPKGKRISFGAGGFVKPTLTVSPESVEEFASIPEEKSYAKLGRYLVHKHRLRDNQLVMRTSKGGQIMGLPSMTISPKLGRMINKIISGRGFPSHDELGEMEDSDKDIMYKIFKMSRAEGLESLPKSTIKNKQERDFNEFSIAKGEILAGNNSPELIKKFKTLLLRLMSDGQIVRREGHDILLDLVALGF